jgi:hypothetical protein
MIYIWEKTDGSHEVQRRVDVAIILVFRVQKGCQTQGGGKND